VRAWRNWKTRRA